MIFLILATGAQYNNFGHDDWAQIATGLISLTDSEKILTKVLLAFEHAEEIAALNPGRPVSPQVQQLLTL